MESFCDKETPFDKYFVRSLGEPRGAEGFDRKIQRHGKIGHERCGDCRQKIHVPLVQRQSDTCQEGDQWSTYHQDRTK